MTHPSMQASLSPPHHSQLHHHHRNNHNNALSPPPSPSRTVDPDCDPPFSRLFVVHGRNATQTEIVQLFEQCGTLEYCRMLIDRATKEPKGASYLKYIRYTGMMLCVHFDRTSSAALAVERFHGHILRQGEPPLKVMIAEAKGAQPSREPASREPEDTPPRSRLFVTCSKEYTEETLTQIFSKYPDFEYCKLVRDKHSNESKCCAFVKFSKASSAALAMEDFNQQRFLRRLLNLDTFVAKNTRQELSSQTQSTKE